MIIDKNLSSKYIKYIEEKKTSGNKICHIIPKAQII